jgi:hypothetical protein
MTGGRVRLSEASGEASVTVVYLAHGPLRLVRCAAFSALTFMHVARTLRRPSRLVVYTDKPQVFRQCGVRCELVPVDALRTPGPTYLHRTKILALRHAAARSDGDILFVDGDTYFQDGPERDLAALSARRSIMHMREYTLGGADRGDLLELVRSGGFQSPALEWGQTQPEIIMWNAGVVGIAEANKPLIAEALSVSDELNSAHGVHVCEQLAWTLVLSRAGEIVPMDATVYHYWDDREELTHTIMGFLRHNRKLGPAELSTKAYDFRPRATEGWRPPLIVRARTAARSALRTYQSIGSSG